MMSACKTRASARTHRSVAGADTEARGGDRADRRRGRVLLVGRFAATPSEGSRAPGRGVVEREDPHAPIHVVRRAGRARRAAGGPGGGHRRAGRRRVRADTAARRPARCPTRTRPCRSASASPTCSARMTLAEKIGQMTQAERASDRRRHVARSRRDNLGSVLSGGGSVPTPNTPTAWADMVDRYQRAALATRLHIPLIYGVDTVHGDGNMLRRDGLPAQHRPRRHARPGAGRARSSTSPPRRRGRPGRSGRSRRASAWRATTAGAAPTSRSARTPALVRAMETAIDGFQGPPGPPRRPRPRAGHRQALRRRRPDHLRHRLEQREDRRLPDRPGRRPGRPRHVRPARARAVRRRPCSSTTSARVMPSYSDVDWTEDGLGNPINMHGNGDLITGWLKDAAGLRRVRDLRLQRHRPHRPGVDTFAQQVAAGVNAGIDMFMQPYELRAVRDDADRPGRRRARPDGAHRRRGLADPDQEVRARAVRAPVHRPHAHRPRSARRRTARVARRAVAGVAGAAEEPPRTRCPSAAASDVYVAGSNADNIGNQAGGWTLTWQGGSTNVIPGTTILDGIRQHAARRRHLQRRTPRRRSRSDAVGVVVVGETPYSEGFGDVGGPQWAYDPGDNGVPRPVEDDAAVGDADKAAVDKVCAAAKRVRGRGRLRPAADHRPGAAAARSTRSSRRGCRAARARAWPTRCSARARSPASCR